MSFLDQFSFGNQFGPSTSDCECQTDVCESSDEGIQVLKMIIMISLLFTMTDMDINRGYIHSN